MRKLFLSLWLLVSTIAFSQNNYYVDNAAGSDNSPGTIDKPWKSVTPVNRFNFEPGDILYFKGSQTFGQVQLQNNDNGLTIKSYSGVATLAGLYAYNVGDITLDGLNFVGPGTVNKVDGVKFYMDASANGDLNNIIIKNTSVSNFGGNGILLGAWTTSNGYNNVQILNCNVYGNYVDGIATYGYYDEINHTQLYINNVKVYNNYGRTDITSTRTGSGVVVGGFNGGTIENSEAYNNGKNNRYSGGGPQGFWCYNSSNIIFQNSVSHDNKAGNRFDGGGFDIDGGSQNCTIQYCYSYNNEGAGLAFFEHGSTNQFNYNTIRYNISQNDARRNAHGSIMMWAQDTFNRVKNSYVYNNTIYVTPSATASAYYPVGLYMKWTNFKNISFYNNILYVTDTIKTVVGSTIYVTFSNNDYYNPSRTPNFTKGGVVKDPLFKNIGGGAAGYVLNGASPAINAGKASPATQDFIGNPVPFNVLYDIGAYEMKVIPPKANAGADKIITMPTNSVTLSGTGTDADGTIQAYSWTKISGPTQFTIGEATSATTSITDLVEGYYTFRLKVTDNDGAIATDDVLVVVYPAPAPAGSKYVKVNVYGGSNAYANTEWNNWNVSSSLNKSALKYSNGTASSVGVILSANSYVSDNGSTYGSGMAPAEVLRYTSTSSATSRTLTINGLSTSKTYRLELYASRNATGNSTVFTVGATSQTILTDKNKLYKASFVDLVPNSSGQIIVTLKKLNSYTYLNGFMLTELPTLTTAIPMEVPAAGVTEEQGAELQAQAYPNPSQHYFSLHISSSSYKTVQLQVLDAVGRVIDTKRNVTTNATISIGQTYTPGVYFAEVMQDNHKVVVRLVKNQQE